MHGNVVFVGTECREFGGENCYEGEGEWKVESGKRRVESGEWRVGLTVEPVLLNGDISYFGLFLNFKI
jgi:hypothetical protein